MSTPQVVSLFDPVANAYREIPIELARKFVESAAEVKVKLDAIDAENNPQP